ncbi:caspase-3-like isoform X2 [Biomphalaria glabrata]|nr:caspase-3-like isoform X2 [Biomphalaria glabrata]XP_055864638.1 caspase-3-like isoform X2 [Biomphalaria glabrata]
MNQNQKDILRHNYMQLAEYIMPSIEQVCKNLWMAKVISKPMMEDILEGKNTNRKRAMALLDLLPSRGPHAFDVFFRSLEENDLFEAAYLLKPEQRKSYEDVTATFTTKPAEKLGSGQEKNKVIHNPEFDELPDTWPSAEALKNCGVRIIQTSDTEQQQLYKVSLTPKGQLQYYQMKSEKRGKVLVINNAKFETLTERDGSGQDEESIYETFRELKFEVQVLHDKTHEEIESILETESKSDFSEFDCFILFVLSHGHKDVVYGTDGYFDEITKQPKNCVQITYLKSKLCTNKSLIGKPKMFFIQACQGNKKDSGLFINPVDQESNLNLPQSESSMSQESDIDLSKNPALSDSGTENTSIANSGQSAEDQTKHIMESVLPTEAHDAYGPKLPSQAEVFVALATTAGYLSWRNTMWGTWFIRAITFVFAKYAYKYDLNKLMTMVNSLVAKAETIKGKYKQVAEKRDTFTKTLYFFPGLPENSIDHQQTHYNN